MLDLILGIVMLTTLIIGFSILLTELIAGTSNVFKILKDKDEK